MREVHIFYSAKQILKKKALRATNDSLVPTTCRPELLLLWPHAIPEELDHLSNRIGLRAPSHSGARHKGKTCQENEDRAAVRGGIPAFHWWHNRGGKKTHSSHVRSKRLTHPSTFKVWTYLVVSYMIAIFPLPSFQQFKTDYLFMSNLSFLERDQGNNGIYCEL